MGWFYKFAIVAICCFTTYGVIGQTTTGRYTTRGWTTRGGTTGGSWTTRGMTARGSTTSGWQTGGTTMGGFTSRGTTRGPWTTRGMQTTWGWQTGGTTMGGFTSRGTTRGPWTTRGMQTTWGWQTGGTTRGGFTSGGTTRGPWTTRGMQTTWGWPTGGSTRGGFTSRGTTRGPWTTRGMQTTWGWPTGGTTMGGFTSRGPTGGSWTTRGMPTGGTTMGGFTSRGPTGGSWTTLRTRLNYECPLACDYCKRWRSLTKTCMAYDEYGVLKSDFETRMSPLERRALNETGNHTVWRVTAHLATCEGLRFYLHLWMSLSRRNKDNLITFIKDPRNITVNEMRELPRMATAILDPAVEANMYSLMSLAQNKTMCENIDKEDCITREFILRQIDCKSIMMSDARSISKDSFLSFLDADRNVWSNDDWNTTIKYFPDSLDYDDYKICPIDILIDTMRDIGQQCEKFDRKTKDTILNRTTEGYDRIKTQQGSVPQDVKDDWKYMVGKCGGSVDLFINKIDAMEALKTMDFKDMDSKNKFDTMERIMSSVNISAMDEDTIANSITIMVDDKAVLDQLPDAKLENALDRICNSQTLEQDQCRNLLKRVKKMASFADASALDSTKVETARCLMPCYPMSDFSQIPQASLKSAIASGSMKNMTVGSKDQVDQIKTAALSQFNKPNGDFSSAEVEKIGPCLLAFGPDALENIPTGSFTADVSNMLEEALNAGTMAVTEAVRAKLAEKVKLSRGISEVLASKNLADSVSVDDIENAQISDFTDLAGESSEVTLDVGPTKAAVLMKKIKTEVGDFSGSNFTLKRFKNLKKLLSGITTQDIQNIPKDNSFLDKIHVIADAENLNREQIQAAHAEYKTAVDFDATDATALTSNTDSDSIDRMSTGVLMMHSKSELQKYGSTVCTDIIKKLSALDTKLLTRTELKDKFDFFLDCLNKNSGTITKDDLDKAGTLICGLKSDRFSDLATDAVQSYVAYIDKYCSLDEDERSKLASTALSKLSLTDTSTITTKFTAILGSTITEFTDAQFSRMNKDVLCSMATTIVADIDAKEAQELARETAGMKLDRNDTTKAQFKEKRAKLTKALLSSIVSCRTTAAGRRKRSTTVYTCTELQSIGVSGLSVLTTAEINAFADSTFTDCAETLGSVSDWSSDQLSALVTVAKRNTVWGAPSTWSTTSVYSAGSIVKGLTSAEISTLDINLDAISRLGQFSGWTDTSIANVFSRYLSLYKSNDPSTLLSSELRSFGHATCGATTTHISQISASVYQSSADAVGSVTSCQDLQLQEFANLAKTAYGSTVSAWDTTTISTIGTVIGGLSKAEIATLSELQINAINANHISYIPATAFTGFTVSQINTFSTAQAQSSTTAQRNALSASQLAALEAAAGVSFTSDSSGNSAGVVTSSFILAAILTVIAACFKM